MAFHGPYIPSSCNLYACPNFELSNAVPLIAKLLLQSESWGCVQNHLLSGNPLPYLTPVSSCIKSRDELDWTGPAEAKFCRSGCLQWRGWGVSQSFRASRKHSFFTSEFNPLQTHTSEMLMMVEAVETHVGNHAGLSRMSLDHMPVKFNKPAGGCSGRNATVFDCY